MKLIATIIAFIFFIKGNAQRFDWVSTGGYAFINNSYNGAIDIARDSEGNLYIIDSGNGVMQCQGDTIFNPPGPAPTRSFIYKFDPEGNLIFMKVIGSSSNPKNLEVDENDNLYVFTQFTSTTLDLPNDTTFTVQQGRYHVIKFDKDFKFKAIFNCGAPTNSTKNCMMQYSQGNIYVPKNGTILTKLDTNLTEKASLSPLFVQNLTAMPVDFRGSSVFANGDLLFAVKSKSILSYIEGDTLRPTDNVFLTAPQLYLRCDTNLNVIWAKYFGNFRNPDSHFLPVTIGNDDQIYSLVQVNSQLIVGTDTINGNASNIGTFTMLKISDAGDGVWARQFGDVHLALPYFILNIPDGSGVFACGTFSGSPQFGQLIPDASKGRSFITKMDYQGNYLDVFTFTGSILEPTSLATDGQGSFYVGGKCHQASTPLFSCEERTSNSGFYLARFTEEPDEAPQPNIEVNGNLLTATPTFSGNIQWFFNEEAIPGATEQTYSATENGNYSVQYAYIDGCISEATSEVTNVVVSFVLNLENQTLKVYPNPANEFIIIETDLSEPVELMDISGRTILIIDKMQTSHHQISVEHLETGIYLFKQGNKAVKWVKR